MNLWVSGRERERNLFSGVCLSVYSSLLYKILSIYHIIFKKGVRYVCVSSLLLNSFFSLHASWPETTYSIGVFILKPKSLHP